MYQSAPSTTTATSPAPNTPSSSRPTPSTTSKWTNGRARSRSTLSTSTPGSTRSTRSPGYSTSPDSTATRSERRLFHGWEWVSNHFRFRFFRCFESRTCCGFLVFGCTGLYNHWASQWCCLLLSLHVIKPGECDLKCIVLCKSISILFFSSLPIN